MIDKIWAAVGRATFLPTEGKAHVGVGTICVGGVGGQNLLSGWGGVVRCYSRRRRCKGAGPGSAAGVMVNVV